MDINKVEYNGENGTETLIDLTADTVTPETLVKGATAHDRSGANIIGTADYAIPSTSITSPFTDSANALVQGLTVKGRSHKSKNLLEITADTQTLNGVTFTVDKVAGTITANGTATSNALFTVSKNFLWANGKAYVLSGCENGSSTTYEIRAEVGGSIRSNYTNGTDINGDGANHYVNILVRSNTTVSNLVFEPMICTAADYKADPTFEPYFEGIKSVGDNGLTVTTANSDNTLTTSAEFTTAFPLRSTLDGATRDELIIGNGKAEVITRCEVVDDSINPLATPVTTPLTDAEISAFRGLLTFDSTTNITITDEPDFEVDYLKNSDNGQAVADIQKDLQGQIDGNFEWYIKGAAKINAILNHTYEGEALTDLFANEIKADYDDEWQFLSVRTKANKFDGLNICDFVPVTFTNGVTLNAQIAGIITYKGYGDIPVGPHIDFICKELWPTLHPVNKVNYNNGTSAQNHPWLASDLYLYLNSLSGDVPNGTTVNPETVAVDYTADGVYYFLPTQLKNVIIEKKFLLPTRYSNSGLLTDDNSWAWKNIGKLWLPDECEVYGTPIWSGKSGYSLGGSGLQYPLFAGNMNRLKFRNGSRGSWWLLSPYSGSSTAWCLVYGNGNCSIDNAPASWIAAPVCFRVGYLEGIQHENA